MTHEELKKVPLGTVLQRQYGSTTSYVRVVARHSHSPYNNYPNVEQIDVQTGQKSKLGSWLAQLAQEYSIAPRPYPWENPNDYTDGTYEKEDNMEKKTKNVYDIALVVRDEEGNATGTVRYQDIIAEDETAARQIAVVRAVKDGKIEETTRISGNAKLVG